MFKKTIVFLFFILATLSGFGQGCKISDFVQEYDQLYAYFSDNDSSAWHILYNAGETTATRTNTEALTFVDDFIANNPSYSKLDITNEIISNNGYAAWKLANGGSAFNHIPTSGAVIPSNASTGTFLIGSYPTDLQQILTELNYPKINQIDLAFPVPQGQQFNLLNISDDLYQQYLSSGGGFFSKVNGPWIDAAVNQGRDIFVVSDFQQLYNAAGELTGFGKEVHRLEWVHGYRFDPNTKKMIPQQAGTTLPNKTLQSDYTQN